MGKSYRDCRNPNRWKDNKDFQKKHKKNNKDKKFLPPEKDEPLNPNDYNVDLES